MGARRRPGADADQAGHQSLALPDGLAGALELAEGPAGVLEEEPAGGGHRRAAAEPLQQGNPDGAL